MIRWVVAIFVLLAVFYPLLPFLEKAWVGRVPGDIRFRFRQMVFCLPFGSTLLWTAVAFTLAQLVKLA